MSQIFFIDDRYVDWNPYLKHIYHKPYIYIYIYPYIHIKIYKTYKIPWSSLSSLGDPWDPRDTVQFRRMVQRGDVIRADPEAAPRDVHLGDMVIDWYVCIYIYMYPCGSMPTVWEGTAVTPKSIWIIAQVLPEEVLGSIGYIYIYKVVPP